MVGPFFEEGRGSRKFWPEAKIFGIFSIEVAPNKRVNCNPTPTDRDYKYIGIINLRPIIGVNF